MMYFVAFSVNCNIISFMMRDMVHMNICKEFLVSGLATKMRVTGFAFLVFHSLSPPRLIPITTRSMSTNVTTTSAIVPMPVKNDFTPLAMF